ncbi:MAG: Heavy metal efflux outer membrane protein CzcC family [Labilithrix sp.]|nr:Heavy metal efflux outer membrane protein CzcC family [Labilithrix sp.]
MDRRRVRSARVLGGAAVLCALLGSLHPATARADEAAHATAAPQALSLADAVALARTRGYDLLVANAAVKGAEADVRTAGQLPNPTLSAGPARRVDCGTCAGGAWGVNASLSDEGLLEGAITRKRRLREDVARRALEAARFGRANSERVVVAQVKAQYVQTAAAAARLDLTREVAASLQKSVDVNRVRYPRVIDEGQLARVEQEALRAESDVDLAIRQLRQEQIDLAVLLGNEGPVPELAVDRKALDFKVPESLVALDKAALLRTAFESRPDRKQALSQVAQAESNVTLTERTRIPDISLQLSYQQLGSGDAAPQPPTFGVGVGLPLPLFYQQQGEISRANADRQSALVARRRLETSLVADVESAVNTFVTARRVVERYEGSLLERARRARDITQVQYTAGSATLTDLLDAQRSYVQVNSGYLDELVRYWTSVFQLEQAIGKELVR